MQRSNTNTLMEMQRSNKNTLVLVTNIHHSPTLGKTWPNVSVRCLFRCP